VIILAEKDTSAKLPVRMYQPIMLNLLMCCGSKNPAQMENTCRFCC